ncbi:DM13 domain-containing protein [Arthrobacter globiformis]|nr:DM13 domain-containing protein [Arthrobacter globiformis]
MTLEGKFQSQAAVTDGSAMIHVTNRGAVLQLKDFSTAPGEDLRLMLSPGTLSPNDEGDPAITSSELLDLGPIDDTASLRIHMDTKMWSSIRSPIRSVVIYNNAERTAYGTANLTQQL